MRIGAILAPTGDWQAIADGARAADEAGLDAIGLWCHYQSAQPEWAHVNGWSAYGALASITERVRLVPMVLNNLHYQPGVLAKESSVLSLISGDRFELAIGAGDWPESYAAWGERFPDRDERLGRLAETVSAVRQIWLGQPVSTDGSYVRLEGATSTPAPAVTPRVVIGIGGSRRTARATVDLADEFNIYADEKLLTDVRQLIAGSGRPVDVSMFFDWSWDNWPSDPAARLGPWREQGVDRFFISVGWFDMAERAQQLAALS